MLMDWRSTSAGRFMDRSSRDPRLHQPPSERWLSSIVLYALGYFNEQLRATAAANASYSQAAAACPDYCFPSRLDELLVLQRQWWQTRGFAAAYYLGNLLYDRRRHHEAIWLWERSAQLDPSFSVVWRNLGVGYFTCWAMPLVHGPH